DCQGRSRGPNYLSPSVREARLYPVSHQAPQLLGTLDVCKPIQQDLGVGKAELSRRPGKLEDLRATSTQLAQYEISWIHTLPHNPTDSYVDRSRLPVNRRVFHRLGRHSLRIVTVFGVKIARFSKDKRDLVRQVLLIAWRNYIDITGGGELSLGRIRHRGQDGSRPNDVDVFEVKPSPDFEYYALQLVSIHPQQPAIMG